MYVWQSLMREQRLNGYLYRVTGFLRRERQITASTCRRLHSLALHSRRNPRQKLKSLKYFWGWMGVGCEAKRVKCHQIQVCVNRG